MLQLAFLLCLLLAPAFASADPEPTEPLHLDGGTAIDAPDALVGLGDQADAICAAPGKPVAPAQALMGAADRTAEPPSVEQPSVPAATASQPIRAPKHKHYFFHGYDYGSQAIFNPLTNILNRGYDVLQIRGDDRSPFSTVHKADVRNVLDNVAHPYARVSEEGRWKFTREELLPLSWTQDTMRWEPNYTLHLIGGGMTYAALREWYEDHDVPWAGLWSAMTVMTSALINESLENKGSRGRNTDCIADIYFFDLGGILFFSFAPINRFFSETVVVSDWSLQPGLTWPGAALNNQGNYFALKWSLPYYPALRLFANLGLGTLFGLSYRLPSGISWSLGAGLRSTRLINRSQVDLENNVELAPSAGLFVDRNESLLASFLVSDVRDYFINFNLYPNAIGRLGPGLGMWTAVSKNGHFVVGISVARALGLGAGLGTVYR